MLKRNIKSFYLNGHIADDSFIAQTRENMERLLLDDIRSRGYVPVLDMDTQWSTKFDHIKERYAFHLEIHAVYVGKRKAQEIEGFSGQSFLPR